MTDSILYSSSGHIGRLVLNNAERHNALGAEQLRLMQTYLAQVASDEQIRVLVVTGAGDKTFCAGASLKELSSGEMDGDLFQNTALQLSRLPVPTICALNGNVFGGGVEIALSCDFRIGLEGSRLRVPAAAIGICYTLTGIQRFVECLGVATAKRLLIAAEELDSTAMLETGFLDHLVLPGQLEDVSESMAQQIAGLAPLAVRSMKEILQQAAGEGIDRERALELTAMCADSEDLKEGLAAQREKRKARFRGH
jgi:enoyl-CoA hydratase/carnithine racemase